MSLTIIDFGLRSNCRFEVKNKAFHSNYFQWNKRENDKIISACALDLKICWFPVGTQKIWKVLSSLFQFLFLDISTLDLSGVSRGIKDRLVVQILSFAFWVWPCFSNLRFSFKINARNGAVTAIEFIDRKHRQITRVSRPELCTRVQFNGREMSAWSLIKLHDYDIEMKIKL